MEEKSFVSGGVRFEIPGDAPVAGTTPEKKVQDSVTEKEVIPMPKSQMTGLDIRLEKTCKRNGIESPFLGVPENEMRFATFQHPSFVRVPPIRMGADVVEVLWPNRMYLCSGAEAKALATLLAAHKIRLIDATPKQNKLQMGVQQITELWSRL